MPGHMHPYVPMAVSASTARAGPSTSTSCLTPCRAFRAVSQVSPAPPKCTLLGVWPFEPVYKAAPAKPKARSAGQTPSPPSLPPQPARSSSDAQGPFCRPILKVKRQVGKEMHRSQSGKMLSCLQSHSQVIKRFASRAQRMFPALESMTFQR